MAKFSERQKKKVASPKKGNVNYALGCLLLMILVPVGAFLFISFSNAKQDEARRNRVKTQYEEGFESSFNKKWIVTGHEFKAEEKTFVYTVKATKSDIPDNLEVQFRKEGTEEFIGTMTRTEPNTYQAVLNTDDFEAGTLSLEAIGTTPAVQGKKWTSSPSSINITFGLYVVWTLDWEGPGNTLNQTIYNQMSRISTDHHNLPLTHFFHPYDLRPLNYVKQRRDQFGDEIGVHFHNYFAFVRATGVTPRTSPAWNSTSNISGTGYDVPSSAYPYEEFLQMLNWTKDVFAKNGLGTPISFRSGGWYLDLDNVKALQAAGFKIDSSGRDARFWGKSLLASPWSLGSRTQPYKMSTENINSDYPAPRYDVWQMANNGADSYWFSAQDMITALMDNFQNKPLTERRIVVILSHPHWFSVDYPKLQAFYKEADGIYYKEDKGPVFYTTLAHYREILESDPNPKYKD